MDDDGGELVAALYTVSELAAELGVSRQRVHQLIALLNMTPQKRAGVLLLTGAERRRLLRRPPGQPGRPAHSPK